MDHDRSLLFGVLAVQLHKLAPGRLAAAAASSPPDLGRRLVAEGALSSADEQLIRRLVEAVVAGYEGDAAAALAAFGGAGAAELSLGSAHEGLAPACADTSLVATVRSGEVDEGAPSTPAVVVRETPGRYSVGTEQGRGGIGRVLAVHDRVLGREVALKELLPSPSAAAAERPPRPTVDRLARFLREAQVTGQLEHPSIVPVYELGTRADGRLYYTMKLVRGRSLAEALQRAGSLPERLGLLPHLVDLCQAVAYAHSRGVIHRDLKPANIMVGEFGETMVIDWGLAKVRGREDGGGAETTRAVITSDAAAPGAAGQTVVGTTLGTPVYMPPEQASGELDRVDERSDIYALGAVLYQLLTGSPPFVGDTLREVLAQVMLSPPRPVSELAPDAPPELAAICARAMEKRPEDRYQSARELAAELQRFLAGALVGAHHYRFSEHLRRFVTRHRAAVATAATFTVVLLGVLAGSAVWNQRERQRAEREAATANQVSELLQGIFQVSDPSAARGSSITARELLDRAAERVGLSLEDQPEVKARMLDTIGQVYLSLGLLDTAEPLLRNALEIRQAVLGPEHQEVAESLAHLARLPQLRGAYAEADELLRRALAIQERTLGARHPAVAETLKALAVCCWYLGDLDQAEALLQLSLEILSESGRPPGRELAQLTNNLAILLEQRGRLAEAEDRFREALALQERVLGADHPDRASTLGNLAKVLKAQGRLDEAEAAQRQALAVRERVLGPDHPDVATSLNNLANLLIARGSHDAAEPLLVRALAVSERAVGGDSVDVALALVNLGNLENRQGRYAEAEPHLLRALAIFESTVGGDHPHTATALLNLGSVTNGLGRPDEAQRHLERAVLALQRSVGPDHPELAYPLLNLAELHYQEGRPHEAERLFAQALELQLATLGPGHPDTVWSAGLYALFLSAEGRRDEAAAVEARAAGQASDGSP